MTSLIIHNYKCNKRGPRKDIEFYKSVVEYYDISPDKTKEIIQVLPKIGYYKDFFYLLEVSTNDELTDYLYDYIIDLISQWSNEKYLILAKWLPREKSSFDRKYKFVDILSSKLYPYDKSNERKEKYRKLVAQTAKKLNVLETNLCAKTYDNIDNLTENNLKTYENLFLKNHLLQQRLIEILDKRYQSYDINLLIKESQKKILSSIRAPLIEKYLQIKKYEESYPEDCLMILDINGGMYNNNTISLYSKVIVYSINHTELIINGPNPKLITFTQNMSLDSVKNLIDSNLIYSQSINIPKIISLTKDKYKSLMFVSSNYRDLKSDVDITWQIVDDSYRRKYSDIKILERILQFDKINYRWRFLYMIILCFIIIYWVR